MSSRTRQNLEYCVGAYGPALARHLFPDLLWRVDTNGERIAYLTFDDGPTPHVTPRLLDLLAENGSAATFFLLGKHIDLHPGMVAEIEAGGHRLGLHGFDHLDAWTTNRQIVEQDLDRGLDVLSAASFGQIRYFRPPFGRFRRYTIDWARERGLSVVMWDVMPGDFMQGADHLIMVDRIRRRLRSGSIVVLHDSWNANVARSTPSTLASMLPGLKASGWRLERL